MAVIHGFELIREETIEELNTLARLYRHDRSGAVLLSLTNDDENKVFEPLHLIRREWRISWSIQY